MNLQQALEKTTARLVQAGVPDARLDAEYLVAEALQLPRLRLPLESGTPLTEHAEQRLEQWTRERCQRKPLAYVLGEQPFSNLTMHVTPDVLIPRPETELLVEEARRILEVKTAAVVADIGTGSGNIALSLVTHPHVSELHAVDISTAALEIARANALRNFVKKPVQWHHGDLLMPLIQQGTKLDLIVANLPYIKTGDIPSLSPEVRWEPGLALDGGRDGLAYIANLLVQAEYVLKKDGMVLLEIAFDQGEPVMELLDASRRWTEARLFNDLAGLPRIVRATKGGVLVGSLNY
jgi:release factor glutamine methyltransferase